MDEEKANVPLCRSVARNSSEGGLVGGWTRECTTQSMTLAATELCLLPTTLNYASKENRSRDVGVLALPDGRSYLALSGQVMIFISPNLRGITVLRLSTRLYLLNFIADGVVRLSNSIEAIRETTEYCATAESVPPGQQSSVVALFIEASTADQPPGFQEPVPFCRLPRRSKTFCQRNNNACVSHRSILAGSGMHGL
jgi:hypothetical protein